MADRMRNGPPRYFRFRPCTCCASICTKYAEFQYDVVDGLICTTKEPISKLIDYKAGKLYGIDYSSCIAVKTLLFNATNKNTTNVLELCCAPGAKMLLICDMLTDCIVTGVDIRKDRLGVAKMLARKYRHLNRIQLICADAQTVQVFVPCPYTAGTRYWKHHDPQHGKLIHTPRHLNKDCTKLFDRVLVDVECTLDGKAHLMPKGQMQTTASDLFVLQTQILANGIAHTKPGGYLVYSTCSLAVHENECVVNKILSNDHSLSLVVPDLWQSLSLDRSTKHCHICNKSYTFGMRMDQAHTQTSGMFVALFQRLKTHGNTQL